MSHFLKLDDIQKDNSSRLSEEDIDEYCTKLENLIIEMKQKGINFCFCGNTSYTLGSPVKRVIFKPYYSEVRFY